MKIFITGNATCANRGDAAILRGLLHELQLQYPNSELVFTSRFPEGSSYLLGTNIERDILYDINKLSGSRFKRLRDKIFRNIRFDYLLNYVKYAWFRSIFPLPKVYEEPIRFLKQFDCLIQVGGSFFIDFYGKNQYEWLMISKLINIPVYLVGHSLGPFVLNDVNKMASFLFPTAKKIYLREASSYEFLETLDQKLDNVCLGSDTAWVMPDAKPSAVADVELQGTSKPIIGLTVRGLAPFDKRLGISQDEYEAKIVVLLNELVESGYHIACLSMCTGLDGYVKDDRIVGLRIKKQLKQPEEMTVLMHEYNDLELGYILQKCQLLIGTRLHSVILSLRYSTPAIAIFYEHKSEGVLRQLGLEDWSFYIHDVGEDKMKDKIYQILENTKAAKLRTDEAVIKEQTNCKKMIEELFL